MSTSYWQEWDAHEDLLDDSHAPVEYVKPSWFKKVLRITPASHVLCFKSNAIMTRREIVRIFKSWNWKRLGLVDIVENKSHATIRARVAKRNGM